MKLTVFGEILWDIFDQEKKIGGAPFNFAAHAVRQGADVHLISAVGKDELGDEALLACKKLNVPTDAIARLANYPTGKCQVTLKDGMPVYDLSGDYAYDHIPLPADMLTDDSPSAIYFGTLAQRGRESRATLQRILTKKDLVDEVFFDINIRQHYYDDALIDESIRAATILKVSREEIGVLADAKKSAVNSTAEDKNVTRRPSNLNSICKRLLEKYDNLKMVLVTMDSDGAFVYERGGKITKSKRPSCEVVSTVGAGDAFSAAFLVSYLNGKKISDCLRRAIALASQVCEHVEAVPLFPMDDIRKWKAIYRLLNHVETEVFDCGTLCDSACCVCKDATNDVGIYLFPGEHLLLRESEKEQDWLTWEEQDQKDIGFPESWTAPVYFVNCKTPPVCPRNWRPLQCRTFPLKPVIDENGVLELIWEDEKLPYTCPIIEQNMPIHDDFYKATYTVWMHLLRDPRIMDLVLSWS
ncbi:MAG: hypothetical protein J6S31_06185 [Lachnospiraceae bacterium]|nr:hypothetical protein [Lachnospiraceae bacterium]